MKRWKLLQQEDYSKHTAKSKMDYLKSKSKLKVLTWPSQSPDLNAIEHLWIDLRRAAHARRPKNLTELDASLATKSAYKLWCLPKGVLVSTDHEGDPNFCLGPFSFFSYFETVRDENEKCNLA